MKGSKDVGEEDRRPAVFYNLHHRPAGREVRDLSSSSIYSFCVFFLLRDSSQTSVASASSSLAGRERGTGGRDRLYSLFSAPLSPSVSQKLFVSRFNCFPRLYVEGVSRNFQKDRTLSSHFKKFRFASAPERVCRLRSWQMTAAEGPAAYIVEETSGKPLFSFLP